MEGAISSPAHSPSLSVRVNLRDSFVAIALNFVGQKLDISHGQRVRLFDADEESNLERLSCLPAAFWEE
jgi:hypothetical protein